MQFYSLINLDRFNRNIGKFNLSHIWDRVLFSTLILKNQPFPKGMHTYAHSDYISCSYVGGCPQT